MDTGQASDNAHDVLGERSCLVGTDDGDVGHGLTGTKNTDSEVLDGHSMGHWGQGVVYRAGTSQVHCKEMDDVPSIYPLGTSQVHSEISPPISMQFSQPRK